MLFLQFMLYSSSFVGTLVKNEIPEAALELCQLNIKQLSPDILKFRTKHEDNQDNPFTLNCFVVSRSFLFIFHAGSRGLGSNNFRNSSYKEKTAGSARVSVSYDYGRTLAYLEQRYIQNPGVLGTLSNIYDGALCKNC